MIDKSMLEPKRTVSGMKARRQIIFFSALPATAALALVIGLTQVPDDTVPAPAAEVADASSIMTTGAVAPAATAKTDSTPKTERPAETAEAPETSTAVPAETADAGPTPLADSDPRWAEPAGNATAPERGDPPAAAAIDEADAPQDLSPADIAASAVSVAAPDTTTTAAIGSQNAGPAREVVVAESAEEVAALEEAVALRQEERPDAAFVAETTTTGPAAADAGAGDLLEATTTEWVNFRRGPSNDAATIEVVAGGTAVRSQPLAECVHFCAVEIDGERGYIYKAFIEFPAAEETARSE